MAFPTEGGCHCSVWLRLLFWLTVPSIHAASYTFFAHSPRLSHGSPCSLCPPHTQKGTLLQPWEMSLKKSPAVMHQSPPRRLIVSDPDAGAADCGGRTRRVRRRNSRRRRPRLEVTTMTRPQLPKGRKGGWNGWSTRDSKNWYLRWDKEIA